MYNLNYNPDRDCWWVDYHGTRNEPPLSGEHYVCVPECPEYPIKRIAAMYDDVPRPIYLFMRGEWYKYKDPWVYVFNLSSSKMTKSGWRMCNTFPGL